MTRTTNCRFLTSPWFRTPGSCEPGVQIFAVGDVHGRADAFEEALAAIAHTPRKAPLRILVLLGDLVGKGPASFTCIDLGMESRERAKVDEMIAVPGDHEIMMAQAVLEPTFLMESWVAAGGQAVLHEAGVGDGAYTLDQQAQAIGAWLPFGWPQAVMEAQGWWQSGDFLFVHGGVNPHQSRDAFLMQPADSPSSNHWAWMREPFLSWTKGWDKERRGVIVHGHTPALDRWIGSDADMALLAPLDKRRIVLDADAGRRAQIAWVEIVGHQARVHAVQHGREDAF